MPYVQLPTLEDPKNRLLDFSAIGDAADSWRKGREFDANLALKKQNLAMDEKRLGFEEKRLGMEGQRMANEAERWPIQLQMLQQQLAQARQQGANEAQLFPLKLQAQQLELQLSRAKAEGKDTETQFMRSLGLVGDQPPPQQQQPQKPMLQPQSFGGESSPEQAPKPMNVLQELGQVQMQGGDPNLILANEPAPQVAQAQTQKPQTPRDIIQNMTPGQKAQFGLSYMGKGDAAKVLGDAANAQKLGKEAGNENDKAELKAINGLARVRQIARGFKDEWLTYENAAKQYAISWADSFEATRNKLPPALIQQHADYTAFKRDAIANLTDGIKDATGAAMGVQEEKRIRAGLPDPEKDSPTQFKAKLMGVDRELSAGVARTRYLRKEGFNGQPWNGDGNAAERVMPIDQFKRIIDRDGEATYRELKARNPQAPDNEVRGAVKSIIRQKFGIDI